MIAALRALLESPGRQPVERILGERLVASRQAILARSEAAIGMIPVAERESLTFADARGGPVSGS